MDDQGVESFATGLSNSLNSYLGGQLQSQQAVAQKQQESDIDQKREIAVAAANKGPTQPEPTVSKEMAEQMAPGMGGQWVQNFQTQNKRPPTLSEAGDAWKQFSSNQKDSDTTKADNHQDQLEKQAMDRETQVRGDTSIQRTELQRDASGQAYDTIAKAKSENRPLTELEQNDLIGQLWQARTGKAPTDSDMKLMNDKNGKRSFNHMVSYITGDPSVVGASTDATLANLSQFVKSTGLKADQLHEGYMSVRMLKPSGLNDNRWAPIAARTRGMAFKDQAAISDKTYSSKTTNVTPASVRAKLGI